MEEGKETRLIRLEYEHLTDHKTALLVVAAVVGYNLTVVVKSNVEGSAGGGGGGLDSAG